MGLRVAGEPITWSTEAVARHYVARNELLLPDVGRGALRAKMMLQLGALMLNTMPLGIIRQGSTHCVLFTPRGVLGTRKRCCSPLPPNSPYHGGLLRQPSC